MFPETKAISNKPLINISSPKNLYKINTLIFDETGEINVAIFDTFDQLVTHWSEDGREEKEQINFTEISNACILYQIAEREGQIVGVGDFNKNRVVESIIKHISDDIQNKEVVALEIYNSWFDLTQKTRFIENVSKGRVKVERSMTWRCPGIKAINPIPNFKQFIEGLINAYISTVANEKNIQSWTLEQAIQLLLSTLTGAQFNDDAAKQYFMLHNCIEECIKKINKLEEQVKLKALQERLKAEKGEWLTSLNIYVEQEFMYNEIFTKSDLIYQPINKDGHCLYNAVGIYCGQDQQILRNIVAEQIRCNLNEYQLVIDSLESSRGRSVEQYLKDIETGAEWADDLEISVLMKVLDRPIVVVDSNNMIRNLLSIANGNGEFMFRGEPIFVYYNGHNHYDALLLGNQSVSGIDIFNKLKQGNFGGVKGCQADELKTALEYLCLEKFDKLKSKKFMQLSQRLESIKAILKAKDDSKIYTSMIQRDKADGKPIPSIDLFKTAAIAAIKKVAKAEANIDLELDSYESKDKAIKYIVFSSTAEPSTYEDLLKTVNTIVAKYGFDIDTTCIFESTLLRLVDIYELPEIAKIAPSKATPEFFFMDIDASPELGQKFVDNFNKKFGKNIAEYNPKFNRDNTIAIKLNLSLIIKDVLPNVFKAQIEEDCALEGYRESIVRNRINYSKIVDFFIRDKQISQQYKVNGKSDFLEGSIIQSFGVEAVNLKAAQFSRPICGNDYRYKISRIGIETDFYLGIGVLESMKLVENINAMFPGSAYIFGVNVRLKNKGDLDLQHIAIKNSTLTNPKFLEVIKDSLCYISKQYPDLLENWQVDSGTKVKNYTKKNMLEKLATLSEKYFDKDPELAVSLIDVVEEVQKFNPHQTEPKFCLTSFNKLQQSVQHHKVVLQSSNQKELKDFEFEDEFTIDQILSRLNCPKL
jgi:hypothetical protein